MLTDQSGTQRARRLRAAAILSGERVTFSADQEWPLQAMSRASCGVLMGSSVTRTASMPYTEAGPEIPVPQDFWPCIVVTG